MLFYSDNLNYNALKREYGYTIYIYIGVSLITN